MHFETWPHHTPYVANPRPSIPSINKPLRPHSQLTTPTLNTSTAMANPTFLSLAICFLISSQCCLAADIGYGRRQQQQQGQYQQNVCQIERLTAQEPQFRIQAEAGVTEYWDYNDQQFQCAGVAACRTVVQPRGLLLPQYTNAPSLVYIVQGKGMTGVLMSGCPETYQSLEQSQEQEGERGSQRFRDQHQQIRRFREGDVIALPAGVAHWCYNDGQEDLVIMVVEHTSNFQNQLDNNPRKFLLAGNPQGRQQQQGQYRTGGSSQQQHSQNIGNVFRGFPTEVLVEVFGVDQETARRLQGHDDQRGHIVRVEGELQMISPPRSIQQEEEQGRERGQRWNAAANGLEETICSSRLVQNINNPSRADFFNPRAGRLTTVNRFNLPILNYLQLSAQRGILYRNAIKSPNWKQNAHTIVYATRGESQMQIVDQHGQAVFNERIREGQLVVIPQNFAVESQASNQGFEWISFQTNENPIEHTLAGRTSTIRAMPIDVLANAYQISREEARRLKTNRQEVSLFEPSERSQRSAV